MGKMRMKILGTLAAMLLSIDAVQGDPWIQQNRWMVLGPMDNPNSYFGDLPNNPTPGHDLGVECPAVGDDWSNGKIPFVDHARARWTNLDALGVGAGDVVDFESLASFLGAKAINVKAAAVIYAVNTTAAPVDVEVCTASDDSIQVRFNDQLVTSLSVVRGTDCDCSEIFPTVLLPGKNKIAVVVWQGLGGWGFRMRLIHSDGTPVDDSVDPEIHFTLDPSGCLGKTTGPEARRSILSINACPVADNEITVKIQANGEGDPDELLTVTETIAGQATPTDISNGGLFTPFAPLENCDKDPKVPIGIFTDHKDIGSPCAGGGTVFREPGTYEVTGTGADIWATGDQFQFAFSRLEGDFSISAHIAKRDWGGPSPASRWGKFGLMARQDCDRLSRYAFVHDSSPNSDPQVPDASGEDPDSIRFAGRSTNGGNDNFEAGNGPAGDHPDFLRIDRAGSHFLGYASANGVDWRLLNDMDWGPNAPGEVLVGLAVTSHGCCAPDTITYDQVQITGGHGGPPPIPAGGTISWKAERSELNQGLFYKIKANGIVSVSGNDGHSAIAGDSQVIISSSSIAPIGPDFDNSLELNTGDIADIAGSITQDPVTQVYTQVANAGGGDFGDTGDFAHFAFKKIAGDFDFTAEIIGRGTTDPLDPNPHGRWGRHGLMARKDCSYISRYSLIDEYLGETAGPFDDGNNRDWPEFRSRLVHHYIGSTYVGAQAFNYPIDQRPDFMKLLRRGNSFYGYLSRDGREWRPIGSDTWQDQDPTEPILVGFTIEKDGSNLKIPVVQFKVQHFGPIDPPILLPISQNDIGSETEVYSTNFDDLNDFQVQHRDGDFDPLIVSGRLRMQDESKLSLSTSAFRKQPIDSIDSAVFQFDFDVFFSSTPGKFPADGLTFALAGGKDTTRVGFAGGSLGYDGLGRSRDQDPDVADQNISSNSFSVEFDTWVGGGTNEGIGSAGAPRKYHLGINATNNANSVVQTSENLPDIFDPKGVHARVRYNRGNVQVWLGPEAGKTDNLTKYLEADLLPISFAAPDESAVFGFTAGTGAAAETGEVDNLKVTRFDPVTTQGTWIRCDSNGDRQRDISDPIATLAWLFNSGDNLGCPAAADCNSDGLQDISDAVFDLGMQFLGGPAPPPPYPGCEAIAGCAGSCP
jgi:hypothetical protein